jgi:hypothetical protein
MSFSSSLRHGLAGVAGVLTIISIAACSGEIKATDSGEAPLQGREVSTACDLDTDCACGVSIQSGDCAFGAKDEIDTSPARQCPDFCSGIDGRLSIQCVNHACTQVGHGPLPAPTCTTTSELRKCAIDSDCACGTNTTTGDCDFGVSSCIDTAKQCPDFCHGIDGKMVIVCEDNLCVHKR